MHCQCCRANADQNDIRNRFLPHRYDGKKVRHAFRPAGVTCFHHEPIMIKAVVDPDLQFHASLPSDISEILYANTQIRCRVPTSAGICRTCNNNVSINNYLPHVARPRPVVRASLDLLPWGWFACATAINLPARTRHCASDSLACNSLQPVHSGTQSCSNNLSRCWGSRKCDKSGCG